MKTNILSHLLFLAVVFSMTACMPSEKEDSSGGTELYRIQVGGKFGFINENGKLVIEPQFDVAHLLFGDNVCYAKLGERKGLINTEGKFVSELDTAITWVYQFRNGVALFRMNNGKVGIICKTGEMVLPPTYKNVIDDDGNGFIIEDTLGNCGYVNNNGKVIVPCKYDDVGGMQEGVMVVKSNNKYGYVDSMGVWVIDTIYDEARAFGNGLARVRLDGKWKFINREGVVIEDLAFDEILTGFSCNRAFVKQNGIIEMIDRCGNRISTIDADTIFSFQDGYATFRKNGKYGKIDTTGTIVIMPTFDYLYRTYNGLSIFEKNKKQGVVDSSGSIIIEAKYDYILWGNTTNGCYYFTLIICEDKSGITYYDRIGNLIWKAKPTTNFILPQKPSKEDWIKFFDSRLAELDPIEGIYYVTFNNIAVNRDNGHSSSNGSKSRFYAVIRTPNTNEFCATVVDSINRSWVKKFVQIGESNMYAVVNNENVGDGKSTWAEDGKLILEDPYKFDVTLRQTGNDYYNWYVQCEFIKDYPSASVYEQVQQAEWTGTGFAIADGYIATNYHVINGAKSIRIRGINGNVKDSYKGYVVASDREHDLAIIQIVDKKFDGFGDIPYRIGGETISEVGESVFVLGYPLTKTMGNEVKLTDGIISAESGYKGDQSMYQISAAVQPGNSGGPLFDNDGNVIGVICAKHADAENANYAVKVSYLFSLCQDLDIDVTHSKKKVNKSKSLSKKVKIVQPFVYLVECSSH